MFPKSSHIVTSVSPVTQLPEAPRAPDDDVEKALIEEPFENSIAVLLYEIQPGFIQNGNSSYDFLTLDITSLAVASLLAHTRTFLSLKSVVSHRQNTV